MSPEEAEDLYKDASKTAEAAEASLEEAIVESEELKKKVSKLNEQLRAAHAAGDKAVENLIRKDLIDAKMHLEVALINEKAIPNLLRVLELYNEYESAQKENGGGIDKEKKDKIFTELRSLVADGALKEELDQIGLTQSDFFLVNPDIELVTFKGILMGVFTEKPSTPPEKDSSSSEEEALKEKERIIAEVIAAEDFEALNEVSKKYFLEGINKSVENREKLNRKRTGRQESMGINAEGIEMSKLVFDDVAILELTASQFKAEEEIRIFLRAESRIKELFNERLGKIQNFDEFNSLVREFKGFYTSSHRFVSAEKIISEIDAFKNIFSHNEDKKNILISMIENGTFDEAIFKGYNIPSELHKTVFNLLKYTWEFEGKPTKETLPEDFSYLERIEFLRKQIINAKSPKELEALDLDVNNQIASIEAQLALELEKSKFAERKDENETAEVKKSLYELKSAKHGFLEEKLKQYKDLKIEIQKKPSVELEASIKAKFASLGLIEEMFDDIVDDDGKKIELTSGQMLQVLDLFSNQMYFRIQKEAKEAHQNHVEEGKKAGKLKGVISGVSRNLFKQKKIADREKEIAHRILKEETLEDIKTKNEVLAQLVKHIAASGYEVKAIVGKEFDQYQVQYLPENLGMENPLDKIIVEDFNTAATNFARLPVEADLDALGISRADRLAYDEIKQEYSRARGALFNHQAQIEEARIAKEKIDEIKNNPALSDLDKETEIEKIRNRAVIPKIALIDGNVRMNQFNNSHPSVAQKLEKLSGKMPSRWSVYKNAFDDAAWAGPEMKALLGDDLEKLANIMGKKGGADLATLLSVSGGIAGTRIALKSLSLLNPFTVPIVGVAAGFLRGKVRAENTLTENEFNQRRNGKKKNEKLDNAVAKFLEERRKSSTDLADLLQRKEDLIKFQGGDTTIKNPPKDVESAKGEEMKISSKIVTKRDLVKEINKKISSLQSKNTSKNMIDLEKRTTNHMDETTGKKNESKVGREVSYTQKMEDLTNLVGLSYEEFIKDDEEKKKIPVEKFAEMKLDWMEKLENRINFTSMKLSEGLVNFGPEENRLNNQYDLMKAVSQARAMLDAQIFENSGDFDAFKGREVIPTTEKDVKKTRSERFNEILGERYEKVLKREGKYVRKQMLIGGLLGGLAGELGYEWANRHLHDGHAPISEAIAQTMTQIKKLFGGNNEEVHIALRQAVEQASIIDAANTAAGPIPSPTPSFTPPPLEQPITRPTQENFVDFKKNMTDADREKAMKNWATLIQTLKDLNRIITPTTSRIPLGKMPTGSGEQISYFSKELQDVLSANNPALKTDVVFPRDIIPTVPRILNAPIPEPISKIYTAKNDHQSYETFLRQFLVEKVKGVDTLKQADDLIYHNPAYSKEAIFGGREPVLHSGEAVKFEIDAKGKITLIKHPYDAAPKSAHRSSLILTDKVDSHGKVIKSANIEHTVPDFISTPEKARLYGYNGTTDKEFQSWFAEQKREIIRQNARVMKLRTFDNQPVLLERNGATWKVNVPDTQGVRKAVYPAHFKNLWGEYTPETVHEVPPVAPTVPAEAPHPPEILSTGLTEKITGDANIPPLSNNLYENLSPKLVETIQNYPVPEKTDIVHVLADICKMDPRYASLSETKKGQIIWGLIVEAGGKKGSAFWKNTIGISTGDPFSIPKGSKIHLQGIFEGKRYYDTPAVSLNTLFKDVIDSTYDKDAAEMKYLTKEANINSFLEAIRNSEQADLYEKDAKINVRYLYSILQGLVAAAPKI